METIIKLLTIVRLIQNQPAGVVGRGSTVDGDWSRVQTSILGHWQRVQKGRPCAIGCASFVVYLAVIACAIFTLIQFLIA